MATYSRFSSSPSCSSSSGLYDVFLSFRAEDTRKQFIDNLYEALNDNGIRNFTNHNATEEIGPTLLMAIEQSRILIPVFSKTYSYSRVCLQELAKMLQCYKATNQIVLPIFFNIEPSDVQNQSGTFWEAFQEYEKGFKPEIVNEWKVALNEIGALNGLVLKEVEKGDKSQLVQLVVEKVLSKLNKTPSVGFEHLTGLDFHIRYLLYLLNLDSADPQFVGICGIGGIGKTTMARSVYNQIFASFNGSSFLRDIREEALNYKGLIRLQNQLLEDILGKQNYNIIHVDRGSKLIEKRLQERKVLLILDDVNHELQLNALAGKVSWFGPGSRIIITTRDKQILKGIMKGDESIIYNPSGLDDDQSLLLFSFHAFRRNQPPEEYMDLSRAVVSYAEGLPLTLEVLGSFLFYLRKKNEWKSVLQKLEKGPTSEILPKLKISYDGLDYNEKAIFLDIACFFIGIEKDRAIDIWNGCGFYPGIALNVLIQKSLVRVDNKNKLRMHGQLRDMGRQIVYEERFGERSRLWSREEVVEALKKQEGTRMVEGILPISGWENGDRFRIEDFATMPNLRLLQVNRVNLEGNVEHLPSSLRWLCWRYCPLEILPSNFYLEELVDLDLSYSSIRQAWNNGLNNKWFISLKVLNLSHCSYLAKSPNFSGFPQLEKLILENCTELADVHESIGQLKRLVLLNLSRCINLMGLPWSSICTLHSLQKLILSGCYHVKELPKLNGNLKRLVELKLDDTKIPELPNSVEMLSSLRCLSLINCPLAIIPDSVGSIKSLIELYLDYTSIAAIPDVIGMLEKLEILSVQHCLYLKALPQLPSSLIFLYAAGCISLEILPNLSNLKNLKDIQFMNCEKLAKIPDLKILKDIQTMNCETLAMIPKFDGPKSIELDTNKCLIQTDILIAKIGDHRLPKIEERKQPANKGHSHGKSSLDRSLSLKLQ